MSTDNRFALLEVEEIGTKSPSNQPTTQNKNKGASNQPTPLERQKKKELQKQKNPPQQTVKKPQTVPPKDFDDTGFVKVEGKKKKETTTGDKKLTKQEWIDQQMQTKTVKQDKPQTRPTNPQSQGTRSTEGGSPSSYRTRGGRNFQKNRARIEGGDVNDKNPNRPDFAVKKTYGEDRAPKKSGGGDTYYRKKNNNQGTNANRQNTKKGRPSDKKSGTGIDPTPKKGDVGTDPVNESLRVEDDKKEESSESSEYYVEPDQEGEEKKDNIVRKGYNTYLQKLESDKEAVNKLLEKHQVKKGEKESATNVKDNIQNLNKREKDVPQFSDDKDALFIKKEDATTTTKVTTKEAPKQQTKQTVDVSFKTRRHRGINTIEEMEKIEAKKTRPPTTDAPKQDRPPREQRTEQNDNQSSWGEQGTDSPKQDRPQNKGPRNQGRGGDNYRGKGQRNQNQNRSNQRVGRGQFDTKSNLDFPSLSDNIEVTQPNWPHGNKQ